MNKITILIVAVFLLMSGTVFGANRDTNTALKRIYIIGQTHYVSKGDENFELTIMQQASEKKLVYAMEGLEHDKLAEKEFIANLRTQGLHGFRTGYLYGVEDPFFIIFKDALSCNNRLKTMYRRHQVIDSLSKEVIKTKKNDMLCPLVTRSNQEFLHNFWASTALQANPIFKYLNANKELLIKKSFTAQTQLFARQIEKWSDADWLAFSHEIVLALVDDLKVRLPKEKLETLEFLLTCLGEVEMDSDCDGSLEEGNFLKLLHLTLRNDFIANNLADIYENSEKTGKPLVSILGEAHIEGVRDALVSKGFTVLGKKDLIKRLKEMQKSEL